MCQPAEVCATELVEHAQLTSRDAYCHAQQPARRCLWVAPALELIQIRLDLFWVAGAERGEKFEVVERSRGRGRELL